jgi:uncharacterized protein (DUF433 family)
MSQPAVAISDPLPLQEGPDGVQRMSGTRVTLDVVVAAFDEGATAEEIVQQYPTLSLGDVYAVIGHVIHHRAEVDEYLRRRAGEAKVVRAENERRFDPSGIRARLLARQRES